MYQEHRDIVRVLYQPHKQKHLRNYTIFIRKNSRIDAISSDIDISYPCKRESGLANI